MNVKYRDTSLQCPEKPVILAAGGLLWRETAAGPELLLVFRRRYKDWTLPKGKVDADDQDFIATARREVREETGYEIEITGFAGCTCYTHDGHPKVVLLWNMAPVGAANFQSSEEVERCEWVSFREALGRLSHNNEKELLHRNVEGSVTARHCSRWRRSLNFFRSYDIRLNRLRASLDAYRSLLGARLQRAGSVDEGKLAKGYEALRLLDRAKQCLESGPRALNEGWRYFSEAYRLGLHLCSADELEAEAVALRNELPKKLGKSWRNDAASSLLKRRNIDDQPPPVEHLVKALEIRDEHFANTYFKIDLVRRQLKWLSLILIVILTAIFSFYGGGFPCADLGDYRVQNFGLVFLFGMLGGTMTTCLSIIHSPGSKSPIPEQLLSLLITLARPIIGGAAALVVMLAVQAKVLPVGFKENCGAGLLLLAFAAGFSEHLIMGALGNISKKSE